jgi:hypothetical protein
LALTEALSALPRHHSPRAPSPTERGWLQTAYTIVESSQKHSRRAQDTEIGGQRRDHGECAQPTE